MWWLVLDGLILLVLAVLLLDVVDSVLRSWWARHKDLPERIAERIEDTQELPRRRPDLRHLCPLCGLPEHTVFADFAAIARGNRDLDRSTRELAGLYLIPEVRDAD